MCEPTSIIMAVTAVASAAMSYQQAQNQQEAQEFQYQQNKKNAVTSAQNTYKQNALRQMQESEAAAQQIQQGADRGSPPDLLGLHRSG